MGGLLRLLAVVLLCVFGLAIFTRYEAGRLDSRARIAGYPVISIRQMHARGLLAIGQIDARGVLVVAQVGCGVVALTQAGAGVLFGFGQAIASLAAVMQIGVGLFFAFGQLVVGLQGAGQAALARRTHIRELGEEFGQLLRW